MNAGAASRRVEPAPGLEDVLDQLTTTHSSMVERFGEIVGERCPPPDEPVAYAAKAARLAASIDSATDPAEKRVALLSSEAARHEQLGRLGLYIADYETAHGDPGHAPAMRELGRDHMDLAAGLRGTLDDEQAQQRTARNDNTKPEGKTVDVLEHNDSEVAVYLAPIREELGGLITEVSPEDVERIALAAAREAARRSRKGHAQAGAQSQGMTIEGLSAEPYSEERRAEIFLPIPPDHSPALMTALRAATVEELEGMTNRDADPFWPEELERVAAMAARCVDADKYLSQHNARKEGKTVDEQKHPVEVEWDAETAQREALNRWPKAPDTPATMWPGTQEEDNALCAARTVARHRYGTLTVAAIEADPVAALYLGMPERPTQQLVQAAHFAAQMVENWHDMDDPKYGELVEAAYTRRDELSNYGTSVQSWADLQGEQRAAWRFAMSEAYPGVAAWIVRTSTLSDGPSGGF
jgi:hypothetical protein